MSGGYIGVNKDGRTKRRSQGTMLFNGYVQHNMQQIAALTKVHPISNGAVLLVLWLWLVFGIYCSHQKPIILLQPPQMES